MKHRNTADKHAAAGDAMTVVLSWINRAIAEEGELEWGPALHELRDEAQRIRDRLKAYAAAERRAV